MPLEGLQRMYGGYIRKMRRSLLKNAHMTHPAYTQECHFDISSASDSMLAQIVGSNIVARHPCHHRVWGSGFRA